jgi:hypothetical protein
MARSHRSAVSGRHRCWSPLVRALAHISRAADGDTCTNDARMLSRARTQSRFSSDICCFNIFRRRCCSVFTKPNPVSTTLPNTFRYIFATLSSPGFTTNACNTHTQPSVGKAPSFATHSLNVGAPQPNGWLRCSQVGHLVCVGIEVSLRVTRRPKHQLSITLRTHQVTPAFISIPLTLGYH